MAELGGTSGGLDGSLGGLSLSPPTPESSADVDISRLVQGSVEVGDLVVVLQQAVHQALELRCELSGRLELIQADQALPTSGLTH